MKTLKEEADHYSECHQDVSGQLGKYLVSAVFQDGATSKWVQSEMIKAQIELLDKCLKMTEHGMLCELTELEQQLKELEE